MIDKNIVLQVLKNNNLCVLSTASLSGKSESAIMAFTVKDDFTIFMSTESTTRKIKNILKNSQVSVIVGGFKNDPSLQIDGIAQILNDANAKVACNYMLSVHPELKDYGIDSGKIISVKPQWVRYLGRSHEITEMNL